MKSLLAIIIAGVVLFFGIQIFENIEADKNNITDASVISVTDAKTDNIVVGLLTSNAETMDWISFRNKVENGLPDNCTLHVSDCNGDVETQMSMFRKMISEGYSIIIVDVFNDSIVESFVELAMHQDVALLFMGNQPSSDIMKTWDKVYYIGSSQDDSYSSLGSTLSKQNLEYIDMDQDGVIRYETLCSESFEESGYKPSFESPFMLKGIDVKLVKDVVVTVFSFDYDSVFEEIMQDAVDLVICESSSDAFKAYEYFYNENYSTNIRIAISSYDESAQELVDDNAVMIASGSDGSLLGDYASKLAVNLLTGGEINEKTIGIKPVNNCIIAENNTIVSAALDKSYLENVHTSIVD